LRSCLTLLIEENTARGAQNVVILRSSLRKPLHVVGRVQSKGVINYSRNSWFSLDFLVKDVLQKPS
jgi:hypothetical protein